MMMMSHLRSVFLPQGGKKPTSPLSIFFLYFFLRSHSSRTINRSCVPNDKPPLLHLLCSFTLCRCDDCRFNHHFFLFFFYSKDNSDRVLLYILRNNFYNAARAAASTLTWLHELWAHEEKSFCLLLFSKCNHKMQAWLPDIHFLELPSCFLVSLFPAANTKCRALASNHPRPFRLTQ